MDSMTKLKTVERILTESTVLLSDNLHTDQVLRHLKSRGALTSNDCTHIKAKTTEPDKVEKLLETLQKKPVSSYETFMEVLREKRSDLYEAVKEIEDKHYGQTG